MEKKLKLKTIEKKALFERLTKLAGKALIEHEADTGYTGVEIAEDTNITASRLPEIKYPERYNNKLIGEKDLCKLIRSGILTISQIKSDLKLTEKEAAYVESLKNYENKDLHAKINRLIELGADPIKELDVLIKKFSK